MSLVVIGTVAFDAIETPFGKTDRIIGGSASYAGLAASYFYKKVKIVAVVGDDFPQSDIEDFNSHGIDTEGLQVKKGEKSFFLERQIPQRHEQPGHPGYRPKRTCRF